MTDCEIHECFECGAHWPEDQMKQDPEGNWYCKDTCYPKQESDEPDWMYVAHCQMED